MRGRGYTPVQTQHVNEGQGDLLPLGEMILAGTGFRTDPRSHAEIAEVFGRPVVSLQLVDPRFYHLDTALSVLDDTTIAYYPPAFTEISRARLETLFPEAIVVESADAYVLASMRSRMAATWCTRPLRWGSPSSCPVPVSSRSV